MKTLSTLGPGQQAQNGQDLRLDSKGNIAIVDGLESVRQRIIQRLLFWRGEWFLDTNAGVPYREAIFRNFRSAGLAGAVIGEQIERVEDVTGTADVEVTIDPDTRSARYDTNSVSTIFGTLTGIGGSIG